MNQFFTLLLIYTVCLVTVSNGFIVGCDLGTEFFKIASANLGRPLEIVLNSQSKRKTPTVFSVAGKTLEFGDVALGHVAKTPSEVVTSIPALLGKDAKNQEFQKLLNIFQPLNVTVHKARNTPLIYFASRNITLSVEEVMAEIFKFIQETVNTFMGRKNNQGKPHDIVVTIPESYGVREKRALMNAVKLSKMHLLSFVSETSAAALQHALDLPSNYTGIKLFVNVGSYRTQACVVSYNFTKTSKVSSSKSIRTVTSKGCSESDQFGGKHFDTDFALLIAKSIAEKFKYSFNEIQSNAKIMQRILKETTRLKLILSTNKQAEFYVENLIDGQDYFQMITRDSFDGVIKPRFPYLRNVIKEALLNSNSTLEDVHEVEMFGGSWRVPSIITELEATVKPHELKKHLNSDEAAALGAVLVAANSSSIFRLKPLQLIVSSSNEYSVETLPYNNLTKEVDENRKKARRIVEFGQPLVPSFRTLTLSTCDDVQAVLIEKKLDGTVTILQNLHIIGVKDQCEMLKPKNETLKASISVSISSLGLVSFDKSVVYLEEEKISDTTTTTTTVAPVTITMTTANVTAPNNATATPNNATATPNNATTLNNATTPKPAKPHIIKRAVNVTTSIEEFPPFSLSESDFIQAEILLNALEDEDVKFRKLTKLKNKFEEQIYSTRHRVTENEDLYQVTTAEFRETLTKELESMEAWFDQQGSTASVEDFVLKLDNFDIIMSEAEERASQAKGRQKLDHKLRGLSELIEKRFLNLIEELMEVDATAVTAFKEKWEKFIIWFTEKQKIQATTPLTETPAYKVQDVNTQLEHIAQEFQTLLSQLKRKTTTTTTTAAPSEGATTVKSSQNDTTMTYDSNSTTEIPPITTTTTTESPVLKPINDEL